MKTSHYLRLWFGATGLILAGCATSSNAVIGDASDTRVYYNDPVTERRVSIVKATDYRQNGLLNAVVTLKNRTDRNIRVQYQFQWYDTYGNLVMPNNDVYQTLLIEGRDAVPLSAVAPRPDVVEYKFKVTKVNKWERGPDSF